MNRTLIPLILIIISITAFFMWINPHYANTKVLNSQLAESNDALDKVTQLETVRKNLVDQENSLSPDDLTKLQKLLPDNVDNIRLFLDMQGVALRYSTSIQDISIPDQGSKPVASNQPIGPSSNQYGQMTLMFSVNTSYEHLQQFLKDLERSLRMVEIKSMSFVADDKSPNTYKVSLGIDAFWLNPKMATTLTSSQ